MKFPETDELLVLYFLIFSLPALQHTSRLKTTSLHEQRATSYYYTHAQYTVYILISIDLRVHGFQYLHYFW